MIFVLSVWLISFCLCFAIGLLGIQTVYRVSGKHFARTLVETSDICAIGFVLIYAGSLCWSLFLPINPSYPLFLILLSLLSFLFCKPLKPLKRTFKNNNRFSLFLFWIFALPLLLLIAHLAAGPVSHYDTYLYHLNGLRWNSEYGAVKGIANIHGRLGFNSSFLNFASLLDAGPLRGLASHFALSFLAVFSILRTLDLSYKSWGSPLAYLSMALCLASLKMTLSKEISSLSTDNAMAYFCVLTVLEFLRCPSSTFLKSDRERLLKRYARQSILPGFLFVSFGALTFTSKLSGSAFLILVGLYLVYLLISFLKSETLSAQERQSFFLSFFLVSGMCLFILVTQILRNILISGWIFYPLLPFPKALDWAVSYNKAMYELAVIKAWGRIGSTQLEIKFSEWFPIWIQTRFVLENKIMLVGGCILSLLNFLKYLFLKWKKTSAPIDMKTFFLYPSLFICFVSWFFNAPDQRFIILVFPIFLYTSLLHFTYLWFQNRWIRSVLFISTAALLHYAFIQEHDFNHEMNLWSVESLSPPKVRVYPVQVSSEKIYDFYVPTEVDLCGDSPIPCSPFVSDDLRFYNPDRIEKGIYRETCNAEGFKNCPHVDL